MTQDHFMPVLMGAKELTEGEKIQIELIFKNCEAVGFEAVVKDE